MLRRYIPGKGYVNLGVKDNKTKIIQSYSTIKGICNLGSFSWNSKIGCSEYLNINSQCYSLPTLDGGGPNLLQTFSIDGGQPTSIQICSIDGGKT
jgi:hypothetical protein